MPRCGLTALIGAHDDDIVDPAAEAVLRPAFEHYYNTETLSPEGDVVRGIDWLGNAGFVRNLIEKARDHRNARFDDADLDAMLAADDFDPAHDTLLRRFREQNVPDGRVRLHDGCCGFSPLRSIGRAVDDAHRLQAAAALKNVFV